MHSEATGVYIVWLQTLKWCCCKSFVTHLKRLRVLCSSIRVLLPVRSSSCRVPGSESGSGISFSSLQLKSTSYKYRKEKKHQLIQAKQNHKHTGWGNNSEVYLTLISGRLRISGKTVMWLECAMSVCSLLQLDTVDGIVFSLLPLRFSSSSCSSLLNLLKNTQKDKHKSDTSILNTTFILNVEWSGLGTKATHLAGNESNWL